MKSLALTFCLIATPALAAPPIPFCDFLVPDVFGHLVCAGVQYGGGTGAGPSAAPTRTTVSISRPTPPTPPSPPSDSCGPKGGEGHHGGHHGKHSD